MVHFHSVCTFFLLLLLVLSLPNISGSEIQMGTTILAARYENGIVIGADTRTSVSGYVSNRFASKLNFVLDASDSSTIRDSYRSTTTTTRGSTCCIARSGSAADTQKLCHLIQHELMAREILQGISGTVTNAAYLARCYLRDNPEWSCGIICAGYDHVDKCGKIYSISPSGAIMEEDLALGGSGSSYIMGHVDSFLRERRSRAAPAITEEECIDFVGRSIELALGRDGSSGGYVCIYVIDQWGSRALVRMPSESLGKAHLKRNTTLAFAPPQRRTR